MTIGEYRQQLEAETRQAVKEDRKLEAIATMHLLDLLRELDWNSPANLLTFPEVIRVASAASDLADEEFSAGRINAGGRLLMCMEFCAHAEAEKHRGAPLDLDTVRARVLAAWFDLR